MKDEKKRLSIYIESPLWKRLKEESIRQNRNLSNLIESLLNLYFKEK